MRVQRRRGASQFHSQSLSGDGLSGCGRAKLDPKRSRRTCKAARATPPLPPEADAALLEPARPFWSGTFSWGQQLQVVWVLTVPRSRPSTPAASDWLGPLRVAGLNHLPLLTRQPLEPVLTEAATRRVQCSSYDHRAARGVPGRDLSWRGRRLSRSTLPNSDGLCAPHTTRACPRLASSSMKRSLALNR